MALEKDLSLANCLISALSAPQRASFLGNCQLVELKHQALLVQAGQALDGAWFPVDSFVSLIMPADDAPPVQVAMIGSEGMFPTSLVLGVGASSLTGKVQGAGRAFRIHRPALRLQLLENEGLRDVLSRYADVCQTHLARQALCMKHHTVGQRLARCLLMTRDRAHSHELFLTHRALSLMLGVRRESVSHAAAAMEQRGLLSYSRGYMMLLDDAGLEQLSCRCYRADLQAYERTLGMAAPVSMAPHRFAVLSDAGVLPLQAN